MTRYDGMPMETRIITCLKKYLIISSSAASSSSTTCSSNSFRQLSKNHLVSLIYKYILGNFFSLSAFNNLSIYFFFPLLSVLGTHAKKTAAHATDYYGE